MANFSKFYLPALLYCAVLFFISSLPQPPAPDFGLEWGDKINHAGAFGLMMVFVFRAVRWHYPARSRRWQFTLAWGLCAAYGVFDEIHQYFVPGRDSDVLDFVADGVGALLAIPCIIFLLGYRYSDLFFPLMRDNELSGSARRD